MAVAKEQQVGGRENIQGVLGWVDCPGAGNGAKIKMLESGKLEGDEGGLSCIEFEVFMDGATRGFLLLLLFRFFKTGFFFSV